MSCFNAGVLVRDQFSCYLICICYTEWCKVGIGICYDVRFPELAQLYAKKGTVAIDCRLFSIHTTLIEHTYYFSTMQKHQYSDNDSVYITILNHQF